MISFQIKPWVSFGSPYLLIEFFTLVCLWCGLTVGRAVGRSAYGHVITKFSRMGRLLHFLSYGAPPTRCAWSSAMNENVRALKGALKNLNQDSISYFATLGSWGYFFSYWYWWFAAKPRQRGAKRREEDMTSGHRSYESHFHSFLESYISSNRFGADVHVCFYWRWQLKFDRTWRCVCDAWKKNCAKAYLERKVLLKIVTNSFPKTYSSSFKYIKRTEVSWEVHTLYVFRSQQDKKNFRSATLWGVLLYQIKL